MGVWLCVCSDISSSYVVLVGTLPERERPGFRVLGGHTALE